MRKRLYIFSQRYSSWQNHVGICDVDKVGKKLN